MLTVPDYPRIYPRYLILNFHAMVAERFQKVAEGAIFCSSIISKAPSVEGALILFDLLIGQRPDSHRLPLCYHLTVHLGVDTETTIEG